MTSLKKLASHLLCSSSLLLSSQAAWAIIPPFMTQAIADANAREAAASASTTDIDFESLEDLESSVEALEKRVEELHTTFAEKIKNEPSGTCANALKGIADDTTALKMATLTLRTQADAKPTSTGDIAELNATLYQKDARVGGC